MLMELRKELPEGCISDLAFDEWRAGELERDSIERYEAHLETCARCQQRHDALEAESAAFLEQFPRLELRQERPVSKVVSLRPKRNQWLGWASGGVALAAAAVLLLVLRPATDAPRDGDTAEQRGNVRTKGSSHIGFFVKHGTEVRRGGDEQVVHPGDQLRFTLTSNKPQHVAILSLDAARVVSTYYPRGEQSTSVKAVRDQAVDSAVLLDETLGKEQIWGVFCEAPFELEPLRAALQRQGKLPPLPHCSVDEVTIVKEAMP